MGVFLQDLRVAVRALLKTPAFPLAAIGTLAIGIAATTAIFSTVNAALLKPLPYPDPGRLYSLRTALTDGRVTTGNRRAGRDYPAQRSLAVDRPRRRHHRQRRHAAAERRHAGEDARLRRERRLLRAVRLAADARRLLERAAHRKHAADRHDLVSHLAGHVRRRSGGDRQDRSALPRSPRPSPAWRRVTSIRRPARTSGSRRRSIPRPSITASKGSCGSSRARRSNAPGSEMAARHGQRRPRLSGERRHGTRLRGPSAHRIDRRRARADPRGRALGDGRAAAAGVRERDQSAAGARRGAWTRDGRARGAWRRTRTHRAAAAHRIAAARRGRRRRSAWPAPTRSCACC